MTRDQYRALVLGCILGGLLLFWWVVFTSIRQGFL